MCGINKVLRPTNTGHFPTSIGRKSKRPLPVKQVQFYSDTIREMAKKMDLSMDEAVDRIIEMDAMNVLASSYRQKSSVSVAAKNLKQKIFSE